MSFESNSAFPESEQEFSNIEIWKGEIPDPEIIRRALQDELHHNPKLAEICEEAREDLERAEIIEVSGSWGIGDGIMALRYAKILAEHFPTKLLFARLNPALSNIDCLNVPENCVVIDTNDPAVSRKKTAFSTSFYFTAYSGQFFTSNTNFAEAILERNPTYSRHDLMAMLRLEELGIEAKESEIDRPVLHLTDEMLEETPQDIDVLFAPDAKEAEVTGPPNRSAKSLTFDQLHTIFSQVPPGSKIGILMGTAHPEYCDVVYRIAREQGRQRNVTVEKIETPSLNETITQVLRAKTFVGMDSGTTHLAYEVAHALIEKGRRLSIKEIFNARTFQVQDYALRGLSDRVDVIVEKAIPSGEVDIASMDADEISRVLFQDSDSGGVSSLRNSEYPRF
jgi:hypothetical protein